MRELAAVVRAERKRLGLTQSAIAERAGVSRDWIVGLEKGKPTVEVGLVFRTLRTLGLAIHLDSEPERDRKGVVNLDEVLGDAPDRP